MTSNDGKAPNPIATEHNKGPMELGVQTISLADLQRTFFLFGGMTFLTAGLALFLLTGFMLYKLGIEEPIIGVPYSGDKIPSESLSQRDIYNFYGKILSFVLIPVLSLAAAMICTVVGIKLLRAVGIATTQVISPQDYPILAPAIAAGNEQAISQFIRLSSLSGVTGTFTKIGLTGLPLATISLTIFLSIAGLANNQFFDLAKLTLGAFLGSFVQRQSETLARPGVGRRGKA
jgi:hypothetical protein